MSQSLWNRAGSFDDFTLDKIKRVKSLNPFGTGQGLSTPYHITDDFLAKVSIPLEQGRVFRLQGWFGALVDKA